MHYVIYLNLGSEAEELVRSLWRSFADQKISQRELASGGTPHVTLLSSAPFPLGNITRDLASLARQFEPFEITFSHFGIFPGHPIVLFLGVTHTATLTSLHRRLYDLILPTAEVFDFVRPDSSVFHCTLAYVLQPEILPRAMELAFSAVLPQRVRVTGFEIVECGETSSKSLTTYAFNE